MATNRQGVSGRTYGSILPESPNTTGTTGTLDETGKASQKALDAVKTVFAKGQIKTAVAAKTVGSLAGRAAHKVADKVQDWRNKINHTVPMQKIIAFIMKITNSPKYQEFSEKMEKVINNLLKICSSFKKKASEAFHKISSKTSQGLLKINVSLINKHPKYAAVYVHAKVGELFAARCILNAKRENLKFILKNVKRDSLNAKDKGEYDNMETSLGELDKIWTKELLDLIDDLDDVLVTSGNNPSLKEEIKKELNTLQSFLKEHSYLLDQEDKDNLKGIYNKFDIPLSNAGNTDQNEEPPFHPFS